MPFSNSTLCRYVEDATPHTVGGLAGDDEDLWFFEYRPKRREEEEEEE